MLGAIGGALPARPVTSVRRGERDDMTTELRWGLLAAGAIAEKVAAAIDDSETGRVVAVASRSRENAEAFGDRCGIARRYGRYEELLADDGVDAVYVSTPHPLHAEWAIRAAQAGKHVLCEKPLTINAAEAEAVIAAARANDVFLMEAFAYRVHPHTKKIVELVRSGVIGELRAVQIAFSFDHRMSTLPRLTAHDLGGGGILDIGCYTTSMSRLLAGAALGQPFAEPTQVHAVGRVDPTDRVDHYAVACAEFPGGILADLATGIRLIQDHAVRIYGTDGRIVVPEPLWVPPYPGPGTRPIVVMRYTGHQSADTETIDVRADHGLFTYQVDAVARHLDDRQVPEMSLDDTIGNMRMMDRWREAIGLRYDMEVALATPASSR
jgi:predicted dehydrogenase